MVAILTNNEVGFDAQRVGFPKLGDCMAIVLQTDLGFFGFHATPGSLEAGRSGIWATEFTGNGARYGNAVRLYGSCKWKSRYLAGNSFVGWSTEMKGLADLLRFRGPICGLDLNKVGIPSDATTAYCEYVLNTASGTVDIGYSLMSDTRATTTRPLVEPKVAVGGRLRDRVEKSTPSDYASSSPGGFRRSDGSTGFYAFVY